MLISKWKTFGIFVRMFKKVALTVLSFALMFFFFIMAFSFSFILLLQDKDEFSHIGLSFLKTLVMSTGEMEYSAVFFGDNNEDKKWLRRGAIFIFVIFIVVMVILVMNLLTGLAVDDIQEIQNSAKVEGIAIEADSVLLTQTVLKETALRRLKYKLTENNSKTEPFIRYIGKKLKAIWASISLSITLCWLSVCSCFSENVEKDEDEDPVETEVVENKQEQQVKLELSFIDEKFAQESLASLSTEKLLALNQQSIRALQKQIKSLNAKLKDQYEEHHIKESLMESKFNRIIQLLEKSVYADVCFETLKIYDPTPEDTSTENQPIKDLSIDGEWSDELLAPPVKIETSELDAACALAPIPINIPRKESREKHWLEQSLNDPADWRALKFYDT